MCKSPWGQYTLQCAYIICIHVHIHTYRQINRQTYTYICRCVYMYISTYVYICICVYIDGLNFPVFGLQTFRAVLPIAWEPGGPYARTRPKTLGLCVEDVMVSRCVQAQLHTCIHTNVCVFIYTYTIEHKVVCVYVNVYLSRSLSLSLSRSLSLAPSLSIPLSLYIDISIQTIVIGKGLNFEANSNRPCISLP